LAFHRKERIMFWYVIGGIVGFSLAVIIISFLRAERYCVCRCTHGRCGRDIDGDDLLCDWCRSLRLEGIIHCHIPAVTRDGRPGSAILMQNPNKREASLCAAGHITSEIIKTIPSASNTRGRIAGTSCAYADSATHAPESKRSPTCCAIGVEAQTTLSSAIVSLGVDTGRS